MVWVKFNRDFDWKPKSQVTIAYRAGSQQNVPRAAADAAVAKGAGTIVEKAPARKAAAKSKEDDGAES